MFSSVRLWRGESGFKRLQLVETHEAGGFLMGPLCAPLRALKLGYLTQDMIDDYEPGLMFTIPRLAIVW